MHIAKRVIRLSFFGVLLAIVLPVLLHLLVQLDAPHAAKYAKPAAARLATISVSNSSIQSPDQTRTIRYTLGWPIVWADAAVEMRALDEPMLLRGRVLSIDERANLILAAHDETSLRSFRTDLAAGASWPGHEPDQSGLGAVGGAMNEGQCDCHSHGDQSNDNKILNRIATNFGTPAMQDSAGGLVWKGSSISQGGPPYPWVKNPYTSTSSHHRWCQSCRSLRPAHAIQVRLINSTDQYLLWSSLSFQNFPASRGIVVPKPDPLRASLAVLLWGGAAELLVFALGGIRSLTRYARGCCTKCGYSLRVPDTSLDAPLRCPECGAIRKRSP